MYFPIVLHIFEKTEANTSRAYTNQHTFHYTLKSTNTSLNSSEPNSFVKQVPNNFS